MPRPLHVEASNPYPWPYDGFIDGPGLALLVCGAQRQLIEASDSSGRVAAVLDQLLPAVRSAGGRIVWIRHGGRSNPRRGTASLPVRLSEGWHLAGDVGPFDEVVDCSGWDGCFGSDLDHMLRDLGVRSVVLAGFASEVTVDSTVRTLNDRGHECLVLTDGCAPLDPDLGARAHSSLTMSGGIFGALGTIESLMHALDRIQPTMTTPAPGTASADPDLETNA